MKRILTFCIGAIMMAFTSPQNLRTNPHITLSWTSLHACPGAPATITVHVYDFTPSGYTWYKQNENGNWITIPGANGTTLTVSNPGTYRVKVTEANCSTTYFASICITDCIVMPLAYGNISAKQQGDYVQLKWTMLDQSDLNGFTVERSNDGRRFSTIMPMPASMYSDYQMNDPVADIPAGYVYYRVVATTFDGSTTISNTVRVLVKRIPAITIAPNPFSKEFTISGGSGPAKVQVLTIDGDIVPIVVKNNAVVQTGNIRSGMYLLKLTYADHSIKTVKIEKQ